MKKQIIAMMIAVAAAASVSTTADASWLSAQQSAEQPAKFQWEQHQHVQLDRQAWPSLEQGV